MGTRSALLASTAGAQNRDSIFVAGRRFGKTKATFQHFFYQAHHSLPVKPEDRFRGSDLHVVWYAW